MRKKKGPKWSKKGLKLTNSGDHFFFFWSIFLGQTFFGQMFFGQILGSNILGRIRTLVLFRML